MSIKSTIGIAFAIIVGVLFASSVAAQHAFTNTVTVDPSGNADETSIQDAIDSVVDNPSVRHTIFIYAGEYDENIVLNDLQENIDLVGVDPQSVIIKPTTGVGVKIESGTETERNNAIRNLTILTDNDHGIEIVKGAGPGATMPKKITIQGVIIDVTGTDKDGILGTEADEVTVWDCDIVSNAGHGVNVGDAWTITGSRIETESALGKAAVNVPGGDNLQMRECQLFGQRRTVFLDDSDGAAIANCSIFSAGGGGAENGAVLVFPTTGNARFTNCSITSDATGTSEAQPGAVMVDESSVQTIGEVIFESCVLRAIAVGQGDSTNTFARGVRHDMNGPLTLVNCNIIAINASTQEGVEAAAIGIDRSGGSGSITMIGGSIATSSDSDKETDVFDVLTTGSRVVTISDVTLSKWKGPIQPASRAASKIQRTLNISTPSPTAILAATSLDGVEQDVTSGISAPDVYRVLSVQGNEADMNQDVFIKGTNFAGEEITEKITLNGTSTVKGERPFMTVSRVILPARNDADETVSVGTTSLMGLQFPIGSAGDVLQQARKSSGATSYTIGSVGTVDVTFATVDAGPLTGGDSIEWVVLASD